jgi:virginiamycin B lyase
LFLLAAGLATLLASVAQAAAPIGTLKQFRVPTANSSPLHITQGSDGNFWFTEGHVLPPQGTGNQNIGRITPAGAITEFPACLDCFPNDIVQGPNNILYFTKNDAPLGRITTSGQVLPDAGPPFAFNGNGLAAHGNLIWITDFNNHVLWSYNVVTGVFTQFAPPTAGSTPFDVAVDSSGIVWFTDAGNNFIDRLDPATGVITETPVSGSPRQIAIATNGDVWFTERFTPQAVGRLVPATNAVTLFPLATDPGPEDIAAAGDGSMWFSQDTAGNVARISAAGLITQGKVVNNSEPSGITVAPNGDPWYTDLAGNKIVHLALK